MSVSRPWTAEMTAERLAIREQFARYGLAQCCECCRVLPLRYLGPLDPQGQQRCANWSDCRDARETAGACCSQEREIGGAADAEAADENELELVATR